MISENQFRINDSSSAIVKENFTTKETFFLLARSLYGYWYRLILYVTSQEWVVTAFGGLIWGDWGQGQEQKKCER